MTMQTNKEIAHNEGGQLLERYREKAGLNKTQLAELLSITSRVIASWEHGESIPNESRLSELIAVYKKQAVFTSGRERAEIGQLIQAFENQRLEAAEKPNKYVAKYEQVGTILRQYREQTGLLKATFAKEFGIAETSLSNWEMGQKLPGAIYLKNLLQAFLKYKVFTAGQELEESAKLWKKVKDIYDSQEQKLAIYAPFDKYWFMALLKGCQDSSDKSSLNDLHDEIVMIIQTDESLAHIAQLVLAGRVELKVVATVSAFRQA